MKKRKSPEHAPGDFKNNPFSRIKGIPPEPVSPKTKVAASAGSTPARNIQNEDDASLFLRAVNDARKQHGPAGQKAREKPAIDDDARLFLSSLRTIGTTARDEPAGEERGRRSPMSRMRQLKRGAIRIRRELDLHGFLKDAAIKRLEHFISGAYGSGLQAVLVITGKGINSPEGPVLQGAVAGWLREQGRGMVAEFSPAPRELGGSGAFVVFLKQSV